MLAIRDARLWDEVLDEEIELLTAFIIATTLSPGRLTQRRVDELLGLTRPVEAVREAS